MPMPLHLMGRRKRLWETSVCQDVSQSPLSDVGGCGVSNNCLGVGDNGRGSGGSLESKGRRALDDGVGPSASRAPARRESSWRT